MSRPAFSYSCGTFWFSKTALFIGVLIFWGLPNPVQAADDCPLISSMKAARHGMQRQWHTQIPLDSSNNRVTHLTLVPKSETSPDTLFVQTERSTVFAIDAETGKTLWAKLVGRPDLVSEAVGCNDAMVAVLNGSKLFILNRITGRILWTRDFPGVPAAGPVLGQQHAYVPLLDGCVVAYPVRKVKNLDEKPSRVAASSLDGGAKTAQATSTKISNASALTLVQEAVEPQVCASLYRIETQPVLVQDDGTVERLIWINRNGMYVGVTRNIGANAGQFLFEYALATSLAYEASPAFVPGQFLESRQEQTAKEEGPFAENKPVKKIPEVGALVAASTNGQINAIKADNGEVLWGYHIGQPIAQRMVAVGARVYVVSQFGRMFCLDAGTGKRLWEVPGVAHFVAQTADRIYVRDRVGESILVLCLADGHQIGRIPISGFTHTVCNDKTDRIFLVTETGFVQSLCQRGVDKPLRYRE